MRSYSMKKGTHFILNNNAQCAVMLHKGDGKYKTIHEMDQILQI